MASNTIRPGDRLEPEQLPALIYVPEPGFSGPAGTFQYLVDDGRGGRAEGVLDIEVMDLAEAAGQMAEAALWDGLRATGRLEDVDTFLRLYPNSYLAAAARQRREELVAQNAPAAAPRHDSRSVPLRVTVPEAENPKGPNKMVSLKPPAPQPFAPPSEPPPPPVTSPWSCRLSPSGPSERRPCFPGLPGLRAMVRIPAGTLMMGQGSKDPSAGRRIR